MKRTKVYCGGTFDLFHTGHLELLREARKIAGDNGEVIVALNTDDFVAEFKGKPPVMSYSEREAVVAACKYVTRVIENYGGADSKVTLERVWPDFIVIGDDWAPPRDYYSQMQFTPEWLAENGISLLYIPRNTGVSSTLVKKRVRDQ